MTIALDDGTPVLAPYQNNAFDAYTREALHVQELSFDAQPTQKRVVKGTVQGYPKGVRRLILSFTFHGTEAVGVYLPSLSFNVDNHFHVDRVSLH